MLQNIFLLSNPTKHIEMAYPDEEDIHITPEITQNMINTNEDGDNSEFSILPQPDYSILFAPMPQNYMLGLIFSKSSDPEQYKVELGRLLQEYFLYMFNRTPIKENTTINQLLLTLFIDIRKYGDDLKAQEKAPLQRSPYNNQILIKVFVFGMDFAGKSSLMRLLTTDKYDDDYFPPTRKFRISNLNLSIGENEEAIHLICWDMPGQILFRENWLRGAQASNILLFVLDLEDTERYEEAKGALWKMLKFYELVDLPLVFLANKTDLLGKIPTEEEIITLFNLSEVMDAGREVNIVFSSLLKRTGMKELKKDLFKIAQKILQS